MKHGIAILLLVSSLGAIAPASSVQDAPFAGAERVLQVHSQIPAWREFRREGAEWRYPEDAIGTEFLAADDPRRTVTFGESVRFGFAGFEPAARVALRVSFVSDSNERVVQVVVDGAAAQKPLALPFAEVLQIDVTVPPTALEDGRVELEIRRLEGPNAVLAALEVWSDTPAELVPIPKEPVIPVDMPRPRLTPRPLRVEGLSTATKDLGGPWHFHPSPPEGFAKRDIRGEEGWERIPVPGQVSAGGFDVPAEQTVGYWNIFRVPAEWAGHRIKLRCDAIYGHAVLWIDGREVAVSERTFTPFEVDVTDFISPGELSRFAFAITNDCLADALTYGTGYARHPLVGILRPLELFAVPPLHAARFHVETIFDEEYEDATLRILLTLANEGSEAPNHVDVHVGLLGPRGTPVIPGGTFFRLPPPPPGATVDHVLEVPVFSPAKWHPEHPFLHDLRLQLSTDAAVLSRLEKRIGFRQVEVRGTQLLVNGRRTKLRGINRHEAHPDHGRSLVEPLWSKDAALFQRANVNFIRTSHYPPDERFLEACDELGLFVEVESPITWIGHGASSHWKEWDYRDERYLPYLTRCALETIERDRSHPSVILWSLGNESLWSRNWERVAATAKLADPTRPFVFHDQAYGGFNNQGSDLHIANIHYPGPNGAERVATGFDRPVLFGEYCHLNVYNRQELVYDPGLRDTWGEALAPMWEKMYASDVVVGGAIWSGISDRFLIGDREVGYGSWGPIDGWRRRKPEYWHVFKSYSPLRLRTREVEVPAAGEPLVLEVENRMEWTDLSELVIRADLGYPVLFSTETGEVHATGAPGTIGTVRIDFAEPPQVGSVLRLFFIARERPEVRHERLRRALREVDPRSDLHEREIDRYELTIGTPQPRPDPPAAPAAPSVVSDPSRIVVTAGDVVWSFDRRTGQARCEVAGVPVVVGGPLLHVDPLEKKYTLWLETHVPGPPEPVPVHADWALEELVVLQKGNTVLVTARGAYDQAMGRFAMEIDGAGDLRLDWEMTHAGEPIDARELGVVFLVPGALDELEWRRRAQWTAYPLGHLGAPQGRAEPRKDRPGTLDERFPAERGPWRDDPHPTGSNAFRATRRHILAATLRDVQGRGIDVVSDGSQHTRAWVSGDTIKLLVAEFVSPGSEQFLGSHWAHRRRIVETGETLRGAVHLRPQIR